MSESIPDRELAALRGAMQDLRAQVAALTERLAGLEELASMSGGESIPAARPAVAETDVSDAPSANSFVAAAEGITEEEFLAISAALAAWLGVHAHIRQIRLIRTGSWAQQGRVTIQTSHRLSY
jgi:methylmalonyl-CoA carboxyltransferase large subunit